MIFLNVSDLAYATVKAVPSKVMTPIVIPTGPVNKPIKLASLGNAAPKVIAPVLTAVKPADNFPNPRNNGAIALTTPPTNIAILPNAVSNGPAATATAL